MKTKTFIPRWGIQILSGLLVGIYIIAVGESDELRLLWMVPMVYSVMSFICLDCSSEIAMSNISGIIFAGLMLLRAVIMPLLMVISGSRVRNQAFMEEAIILFVYEMIVEFFAVELFFKNKRILNEVNEIGNMHENNRYGKVVLFLLFGATFCLFLSPMAIGYYRTIFGITEYEYTGFDSRNITRMYATSFLRKFGLVTFRYLMSIIRVVIPSIIILWAQKKRFSNILQITIAIISIFVFNFLIVDDTIATSIFNALIISIFYRKTHGKPTKGIVKYLIYALIGVIAFFFIRFSFSSSSDSSLYRISNIAQSYFGGLENISAGLKMVEPDIGMRFKYAIYEILRGIPYASTIFGLDNTNISLLFNRTGGSVGQIIPTICSSKLYFGYFFGPIYTLLFLSFSLSESINVEKENKPLRLLSSIIICIYSLMGISVYSPEITWTSIICVGLATRGLSLLFEKDRS